MQEAIRSNWQAERPKVSVSVLVQTDPAELQSQGTQAPGRSDVGVQNEAIDGDDAEDCELADLLEDESNLRDAESRAEDQDSREALIHTHTLTSVDQQQGQENSEDLIVTALAWHPTTDTLAVAMGIQFQVGYCTARGLMSVWSLSREQFDPDRPHIRLETDCALQAIAYNPVYPALLAAGSANGDIFVWDTCCEDEDRAVGSSTSSTADCMHRQSVQCVEWVHSAEEATHYAQASRAFLLCSVGRDGRVLLWRWHACGQPIYGMQVVNPSQRVPMAIQSAAFARRPLPGRLGTRLPPCARVAADSTFQVGTEAGHVYTCTLNFHGTDVAEWQRAIEGPSSTSKSDASQRATAITWRDANVNATASSAKLSKMPHVGPVSSVQQCPAAPNMVLSSGLDGRVRVWSQDLQPLLLLEPFDVGVTASAWSPQNAAVVAVGSQDGRLAVFDLTQNKSRAIDTLDIIGLDHPVDAVAFSSSSGHICWLAVSNVDTVSVHRVAQRLAGGRKALARADAAMLQLRHRTTSALAF